MTGTFKSWLYEYDICFFFEQAMGFPPDQYQKAFLETNEMDILITACRQWGKTSVGAIKESYSAIFSPASLGLVISATQRQSIILQKRALAVIRTINRSQRGWRKVRDLEVLEDPWDANSRLIRASIMSLELANHSEILALPPSSESLRGYSPQRITIDEASRVGNEVYSSTIRPMRATHPCRLTVMSTPRSTFGFFFEEMTGDDPVWWRLVVDADACGRISPEFLQKERSKMSEAAFQCEYFLVPMPREGAIFDSETIKRMFVPAGSYESWAPTEDKLVAKGVAW